MYKRIDLLYFSDGADAEWQHGKSLQLQLGVSEFSKQVVGYLQQTDADWVLFWDTVNGQPDTELIFQLSDKPVDVWHAGMKMGLQGQPDILDYVQPTWMYTRDASKDVEHTSFRLSMQACLVRVSVLKKTFAQKGYTSLAMIGVALGYKIFKNGGVIRYHPRLLKKSCSPPAIPLKDEWVFAKEFFDKKWQLWCLLNKPGFINNITSWWTSRDNGREINRPSIHSSKKEIVQAAYRTVSVLAPTLNRYSYLLNELEQLSVQTILPYEVLITDQTDEKDRPTLDFSKYPKLNIRYFPQNDKGQCTAWNKMLEEARGEFVLFLGDDADDIKPDFIERLLATQQEFQCDMVASNVIEAGGTNKTINEYYYLSDTFPITLIRRDTLLKTGFFDMFFNKNIRADHDVAMRCHLAGALMIFNSSATIFHHRAPVGGLRTHNARVVTTGMVKKSVRKFLNPTSSEIYLAKKYYTPSQVRNYVKIKYLNQLFIQGSLLKKLLRLIFFIVSLPSFYKVYKQNEKLADEELTKKNYPLPNDIRVSVS